MVREHLADGLVLQFYASCRSLIEMTESKAETAPEPVKELLALNPKEESEFKKKVREAKKNQSSKVSRGSEGIHVTTWFRLSHAEKFLLA